MICKPLKTRQICFFFLAFLPITKLFFMPGILSSVAHEDLWISVFITSLLDLLTVAFVLSACKKAKKGFIELLKSVYGKTGAKIFLCLYAVYFFVKGFLPVYEQKEFVKLTLYITMPTDIYFLPFFAGAFYLALKPLRALGRLADVMWLFTLTGCVLIFGLSLSNTDVSAILPVGARGAKAVLNSSFYSLTYFGDCVYLLFFTGEFIYSKKASLKILLCYGLSCLSVIIFTILFWGTFTSIAFRQNFALTEISKYSTVINNTGRFDYLGITLLIISGIISISLPLYFTCYCLQNVFTKAKKWIIPLIVSVIASTLSLMLNQYVYTLQKIILNVFGWIFLIFSNVLPVITAVAFNKEKKYETVKT